ncbi:MAG: hypothetical protein ABI624_20320 [Casimicrobiaceae bacterium]
MNYNICVVKPEGFVHAAAYFELAELIGYSLRDLGHDVSMHFNEIRTGATNIVIGCHLLDASQIAEMPAATVIVNTEQIGDDMPWSASILQWATQFETWDYSERNLARLTASGAKKTRLLGIGFHEKMARIGKAAQQDIDVLFYGSVNERRLKILRQLQASGCALHAVFGVFGEERDKLIARSKVVLNMHQFDAQIFEVVRVFYLMTNAKAVVTEVDAQTSIDPRYVPGVCVASYDELTSACLRLAQDDRLRSELEARALASIAGFPQSAFTKACLT